MGNAPPSRETPAGLLRDELGAVVAIASMLRRWPRSSWRGVFAFARSWRSSCLRTCGRYDRGIGSRHEGASSSWRGWPIRRADLLFSRASSPLRKADLPLRRGGLRPECHKSGDNVTKNETGRVYGIFRSVFPAGIPRIACLYTGCFKIRYIIARFAASGHMLCRYRRLRLGLWGRFAHQLLGLNPRSRRALLTTQRLERLIAAAPNMGESCHPNSG